MENCWKLSQNYPQILLLNNFSAKYADIFLISPQKHRLLYSVEVPHQSTTNEKPQHMFSEKLKKKFMRIPLLIWRYAHYFLCLVSTVPGTFRGQADYGITFSPPSYDVIEETQVTFTCKADVGTEPQGQLEWYYYLSDIPYPVSDKAVKEDLVSARNCSYSQQSRLMLTMNSTLDGILVRCTLRQDDTGPDGDTHNQTNKFSVKCKYMYCSEDLLRKHIWWKFGDNFF